MRQTIRAIGWLIAVLWIFTLLLPITVGLSLMRLLESKAMGIQEPTFSFQNGNFSIAMPFYVNNTGFYDLSNISVNVQIQKGNKTISAFLALLPDVPAGVMVNSSCDFSVSLEEIASKDAELFMNDTELSVDAGLGFRVAYVIALGVSMTFPTSWLAPFYNLTASSFAYDSVNKFSMLLSFVNHAQFPIGGSLIVRLYDEDNELLGSTSQLISVLSDEAFSNVFEITVDEPSKMTDNGLIRVYFEEVQIWEGEWTL
ncbi:MAG: hypothetical protein ACUVUF_00420 [Candidatus Bathycorpusculaceae bacterium]